MQARGLPQPSLSARPRRPLARKRGASIITCTASPVPPPGRVGKMERLKNLISELRRDTRGFMQRRRQRCVQSRITASENLFVPAR